MKFIDYLNEKDYTNEEIFKLIKKNCSQFLKEGVPLYRGYRSNENFFVKTPRKRRIPMNTDEILHKALDKGFKKKFGWKPRSGGVFCSTDPNKASYYGNVYLIFPFDGYEYIWSAKVEDLFLSTSGIIEIDNIKNSLPHIYNKYKKENFVMLYKLDNKERDEYIKFFINDNKYTNKLLKHNKDGHEVMVKCNKYYMLSMEKFSGYNFFKGTI